MSPGVTGAPVCECPPSPRLLRPQEVSPSTCDPRTPGIDVSKLFHGSVGPSTASVECFTPWRPAVGSMLMTGSDRSVILTFRGKPAPLRTPPAILPPARKWRESQRPRGAPSPLACLRRLPRSAHVSSAGAKFPSETSQVERAADSQRLSRHARGRRHECAGEAAGAPRRGSQAQGFRGGVPNHTCDAFREEKGRRTRLRIAAENSKLREKGNSKTEETLG